MLSEEEKKAIENIEHIIQYWQPPKEDELATFEYESIRKLYEMYNIEKEKNKKLQKENEKLINNEILRDLGKLLEE